MGIIREPLAVIFGLLAIACAAGAAWQAGLAWPAASGRPLARIAGGLAVVLSAVGFSLGYWEVLSGIGDLVYHFDSSVTRVLFDIAAVGLPFAFVGLLLGVVGMLHAADVPAGAVIPAIIAGYAIGWLIDPYQTLAGPRMDPVRARYLAAPPPGAVSGNWDSSGGRAFNFSNSSSSSGSSGGGDWGGGGDGDGGAILLLIALAVLAIAGGVITAALVFGAARKKAKALLSARSGLSSANLAVARPG